MGFLQFLPAFLAATLWGLSYTFMEQSLKTMSSAMYLFLSSLVYLLVFLPAFISERKVLAELSASPRNCVWILLSIATGLAANVLILFTIKLLGASKAAALEISYPFFTSLFMIVLFKEKFSLQLVFGGILIFLGTFVIVNMGHK